MWNAPVNASRTSKSLYEISTDYYQFRRGREIRGYDSLLALEEIGAHLEFMEETLGIVQASSPDAFRDDSDEIVRYQKAV